MASPALKIALRTAALLMAFAAPTASRADDVSELEVKAAFLHNFTKYVEWPPEVFANAGQDIRACVLSAPGFGAAVRKAVAGKQVHGRNITVIDTTSVPEAAQCQIVYVGEGERGRLDEVIARLQRAPVLTVSDLSGFIERGGVIGLKRDGLRVRFEVNMVAARLHRLKLSSQLLKVAIQVVGQLEE